MDDDDDFGEGTDADMWAADMRKIGGKLSNDGFRIGKAQEEEKQMQQGFDEGFQKGIVLGRACGRLYGACASKASRKLTATENLAKLQTLLYETVPEAEMIDATLLEQISALVLSLEVDLTVELADFQNSICQSE
jgi:flagellar biosynthesis/type III secretory pathway protein FliH